VAMQSVAGDDHCCCHAARLLHNTLLLQVLS
jgi:hypothetical protein